MDLNISKSQVILFSRATLTFNFNYHIGGVPLNRVDRLRDLGVILTSSLSPSDHIASIASKAYALLGFIGRSTRGFKSHDSMLVLYKSIVQPVLEYGTVIWSPYQLGHVEDLKRVQTCFLRMLGTRLGCAYMETPVLQLEQRFHLQSLYHRRIIFDLLFLFKLMNGLVDCPVLLEMVDFSVPRGTRSRTVFCRKFLPTNYACNSGVARILRHGGVWSGQVDFFLGSLSP
ncbi:uncharacterized protein LOC124358136 [Homalodisca vitripennis]|uniref:uncharacterized protein LOC124358136 n=1 Tax=Homalodisca vitripennis TaxID=197043 RepID=UPI001EEB3B52|nr:uncharacterized protein LOC124358136 [Homalodisca vitripennis]